MFNFTTKSENAQEVTTRSHLGNSHYGSEETSLTHIHEYAGLIPGLAQWVKDPALP